MTGVTNRTRASFDIDRVTKRFFDRFKDQHAKFLAFISGIPDNELQRWYASVMLNRMMFVYFIQRKGYLDGDTQYLRNRLDRTRQACGKDKFYSFYRHFLLRLFHEGLGGKSRSPELEKLLGRIPYLNGGIFDKHEIEKRFPDIKIPDEAFTQIFDYFDDYQWHLDERPLRADNEINPDVLGYIFEKYINQKQMGAYYTKEDITEYIGKNAILPFLLDAVRTKCKIAFENPNGPTVWDLLAANPDRYIYEAVRRGVVADDGSVIPESALPDFVQKGMHDPKARMFDKRYNLGQAELPGPDGNNLALPTETWREYVSRRQRCLDLRAKLANGDVRETNDLITYNLDIRQFAQDIIENSEGPDLLRAFWHGLEHVSVLDLTCGSGAFLFAALNILEPLYEACLDRMAMLIEEHSRSAGVSPAKIADTAHNAGVSPANDATLFDKTSRYIKFHDFRDIIARMAQHPSARYFIFKSIILNNLYGVDIMEEAVEICRLRLFLKLAAQVEPDPSKDNLGIEPLPDIDFNIKAGNTLVGYATYEDVKKAVSGELDFDNSMDRIQQKAEEVERLFALFKKMQTDEGMDAKGFVEAKQQLRKQLATLEDELNHYLAKDYGITCGTGVPPVNSGSGSCSGTGILPVNSGSGSAGGTGILPVKNRDHGQDDRATTATAADHGQDAHATTNAYAKWLASHKPFHWFIEFYGIMKGGGFDVIIGNPPYVEMSDLEGQYTIKNLPLVETGNLFAVCVQRFADLLHIKGRVGVIIPISSISTPRMFPLMQLLNSTFAPICLSNFAVRPGKLFVGVDMNLTIVVGEKAKAYSAPCVYATCYNRWGEQSRSALFQTLEYAESRLAEESGAFPKLGRTIEQIILDRIALHSRLARLRSTVDSEQVFYHSGGRYFRKCIREQLSNEYKELCVRKGVSDAVICFLSSTLYYWFWIGISDCYHVTKRDIDTAPVPESLLNDVSVKSLSSELIDDLWKHSEKRIRHRADGSQRQEVNFHVGESKPILDKIDKVLAKHYGFTDMELDFIINYDIKYRMGRQSEEE
ncbi:MAG: SAM-dependent methyltransferase [bacterium]|nr:SAM-dependent methyltransferase [bacterium]